MPWLLPCLMVLLKYLCPNLELVVKSRQFPQELLFDVRRCFEEHFICSGTGCDSVNPSPGLLYVVMLWPVILCTLSPGGTSDSVRALVKYKDRLPTSRDSHYKVQTAVRRPYLCTGNPKLARRYVQIELETSASVNRRYLLYRCSASKL